MSEDMDLDGDPGTAPVKRVDRIFLRLSVLNTILALAGVFTGAMALFAALQESAAVQKQSAAAVWPYVQFSTTDRVAEDGSYLRLHLKNVGVGPAILSTVRIRFEGQSVTGWGDVPAILLPEGQTAEFGTSFVNGRVLRPGEQVDMFMTEDPALAGAMLASIAGGRSSIEYCYCSIFDDCWLVDSTQGNTTPTRVKACPDFGDEAFGN